MRVALVAVVLATACDSPPAAQPDAYVAKDPCGAKEGPLCTETCGNGVIDDCQRPSGSEMCLGRGYVWMRETCDGGPITCAELGYFGGMAPCEGCDYTLDACDPCALGTEICTPIPTQGQAVATTASTLGTVVSGYLDVYDITGAAPVRSIHAQIGDHFALTSVPGGWLAVSNTLYATHVSDDGTVGTPRSIATLLPDTGIAVSYAAGRVLVGWSSTSGVQVAVLDATNGALVAGPTQVFPDEQIPSIETDGAAFFVSIRTKVAKVLVDGTVAATTSIGTNPYDAKVTCSGTTCWYVAATSFERTTIIAQRLDSNASAIGAPITITPGFGVESVLADGSDLVGLRITTRFSGPRFDLVRIDGSGSVTATKLIGATSSDGGNQMLRVGSRVAILFLAVGKPYIVVMTP